VLLASGYIAGGTLCGLIIAFFAFLPDAFNKTIDLGAHFGKDYVESDPAKLVALATFAVLMAVLLYVGSRKVPVDGGSASEQPLM
jgi:hypothetical protein